MGFLDYWTEDDQRIQDEALSPPAQPPQQPFEIENQQAQAALPYQGSALPDYSTGGGAPYQPFYQPPPPTPDSFSFSPSPSGMFNDLMPPIGAEQAQPDFSAGYTPYVSPMTPSNNGFYSDQQLAILPGESVNEYRDRLAQQGGPYIPSGVTPGEAASNFATIGLPAIAEGAAFHTFVPESVREAVSSVPYGGQPASDILAGLGTPLGIASLGLLAPETSAAIAAKSYLGGVAGQGLEAAGVPNVPTPLGDITPTTIGEFAGPFVPNRPIAAVARAGMENAQQRFGGGFIPALSSEAGGTPLGDRMSAFAQREYGGPQMPSQERYILEDGSVVGRGELHMKIAMKAAESEGQYLGTGRFMGETGAVRISEFRSGEVVGFEISAVPTEEQRLMMTKMAEQVPEVYVDVTAPPPPGSRPSEIGDILASDTFTEPERFDAFLEKLTTNPPPDLPNYTAQGPATLSGGRTIRSIPETEAYRQEPFEAPPAREGAAQLPLNMADQQLTGLRTDFAETAPPVEGGLASQAQGLLREEPPKEPLTVPQREGAPDLNLEVTPPGMPSEKTGKFIGQSLPMDRTEFETTPPSEKKWNIIGEPPRGVTGLSSAATDGERIAEQAGGAGSAGGGGGGGVNTPGGTPGDWLNGPQFTPPELPPPNLPRITALKDIDEIARDVRATTANFVGATTRTVAHIPGAGSLIDLINPSSLVGKPTAALTRALGGDENKASNLLADLLAHKRFTERADSIIAADVEAINLRARAVGLVIKDDRIVSLPGAPAMGDVFQRPGDFPLTPRQRALADNINLLLKDAHALEKQWKLPMGELFEDDGNRYFPRNFEPQEGQPPKPYGSVVTTQGFQKSRYFATEEEAIKAGMKPTENLGQRVGIRLTSGSKAVADAQLRELLKQYGLPVDATAEGLGLAPKVVPGTVEVRGIPGYRFPTEVGNVINEYFGVWKPGQVMRGLSKVNELAFTTIVTPFHIANVMLHDLTSVFRNPAGFAKAAGENFDSIILDGRNYGHYVENNARNIEAAVRDGYIWNGSEYALGRGNFLSNIFRKTGIGRFNDGFARGLNVLGLENYKMMAGLKDGVAGNPGLFQRTVRAAFGDVPGAIKGTTDGEVMASIANTSTGRVSSAELGIQSEQRYLENLARFAPRFYRAAFGLVGAGLQGGQRGAEARAMLASLVGSATLATYVAARLQGEEPNIIPGQRHYLSVKINGTWIGIGGPILSFVDALGRVADDPGSLTSLSTRNPLAWEFLKGQSPLAGGITTAVRRQTLLGEKLETPQDWLKVFSMQNLPIAAQSGIRTGGITGTIGAALGMKSSPQTPAERFEDKYGDYKEKLGKPRAYDAGDPADRALVAKDPELQELFTGAKSENTQEREAAVAKHMAPLTEDLTKVAQGVLQDDPTAAKNFRDIRSSYLSEKATFTKGWIEAKGGPPDPQTDIAKMVNEYYKIDPESSKYLDAQGTFNRQAFQADRAAALARLPQDTQDAITTGQLFKDNPTLQQANQKYEAAISALDAVELIPKYKGMTVDQSHDVTQLLKAVPEHAYAMSLKYGTAIGNDMAAQDLAVKSGNPSMYYYWKTLQGPQGPYFINPEYDRYLQAHQEDLMLFFPAFYNKQLAERLGIIQGAQASNADFFGGTAPLPFTPPSSEELAPLTPFSSLRFPSLHPAFNSQFGG